jgi:hypothetical protein
MSPRHLCFWTPLLLLACDPADEPLLGDESYVRDPALDVALVSAAGDDRSHAGGDNCMRCHQAHGPGPGRFTAAGTVDGPAGALELRDGEGALVLAVPIDALGNFYTTEPLPLPDTPLFPSIVFEDGVRLAMPFPTRSAACNVCHAGGAALARPEA